MRNRAPVLFSLGLAFVVAAGCSDAPERAVPDEGPQRPSLEDLAAIGYADSVPDEANEGEGVVAFAPASSYRGHNLVTSIPNRRAQLVDMSGLVVHEWSGPGGPKVRWTRAKLLADGDLLCIRTAPGTDRLLRLSFGGETVWKRDMFVHHDVHEARDGRLFVLTKSEREIPGTKFGRRFWDNEITVMSADGELLAQHSVHDLLTTEPDTYALFRWGTDAPDETEALLDPIHCNAVEPLEHPELAAADPLFAPTNVVITSRHLDLVAIVNLEAERVEWSWGPGELQGPHDATLTDAGHVLLLDNGWEERGYSRVLEVDPATKEIVWEYTAPERESFFTSGRGTVQTLPNGNVLVGNSNNGEAFELTRAGERVWRYFNPLRSDDGKRAVLRIERYESARVEELLEAVAK